MLMRFLLVCGGLGVFPLYLADKYWPCYQSPTGVQYDAGLAESLQCCFLSFMLSARNYMPLMWLDATWVGRKSVPCLGYERWPSAGPAPFREVWRQVVSSGSQLDFLMHSVMVFRMGWHVLLLHDSPSSSMVVLPLLVRWGLS